MIYPAFKWGGGGYSKSEVDTLLNGKSDTSHTHTKSQITDFPTIPSKTSDLTNNSGFITSEIDSMGTDWVRFKSGLQICWGTKGITWSSQEKETTISFAKSFIGSVTISLSHSRAGYSADSFSQIRTSSPSNFVANYMATDSVAASQTGNLQWLAIGKWK